MHGRSALVVDRPMRDACAPWKKQESETFLGFVSAGRDCCVLDFLHYEISDVRTRCSKTCAVNVSACAVELGS